MFSRRGFWPVIFSCRQNFIILHIAYCADSSNVSKYNVVNNNKQHALGQLPSVVSLFSLSVFIFNIYILALLPLGMAARCSWHKLVACLCSLSDPFRGLSAYSRNMAKREDYVDNPVGVSCFGQYAWEDDAYVDLHLFLKNVQFVFLRSVFNHISKGFENVAGNWLFNSVRD